MTPTDNIPQRIQTVKVLLQHTTTSHYLSASGGWLGDIAQGRSFTDIPLALSFCREHAMFSANVILSFDDTDLNVCLTGPRPSDL